MLMQKKKGEFGASIEIFISESSCINDGVSMETR